MPIIPKTEQGYLQSSAQYTRAGSIDPNFGLGTSRAIQHLGGVMLNAADAMNRYQARLQASEDEMNLQKMQTMMYISQRDIEKQRTENPADYANFEKAEADRVTNLYNKDLKPYYDKLSGKAKEKFDSVIYPRYQQDGSDKAFSVANQARISVGQQNSIDCINTYLNNGEYELARQATKSATEAGYFSPATQVKCENQINHAENISAYNQELENMTPAQALQVIDAQNAEGKPTKYTDFTQAERDRARAKVMQRANENKQRWNNEVALLINNGERLSDEKLANMAEDCGLSPDDPSMTLTKQKTEDAASAKAVQAITAEQRVIAEEVKAGKPDRANELLTPEKIDELTKNGTVSTEDANKLLIQHYTIKGAMEAEAERKADEAERKANKERVQNARDTIDGINWSLTTGALKTPGQIDAACSHVIQLVNEDKIDKGSGAQILRNLDNAKNQYRQAAQNNQAIKIFAAALKSDNVQRDIPIFQEQFAQLFGYGTQEYETACNRLDGMLTQTAYKKDNPVYEFAIADFDNTTWEHKRAWLRNNLSDDQTAMLRCQLENAFKSGQIKNQADYLKWKQTTEEQLKSLNGDQTSQWIMNGGYLPQEEPQEETYTDTWDIKQEKKKHPEPQWGALPIMF